MGKAKIIYQDWIVEIGADPHKGRGVISPDDPIIPNAEIIRAVRTALKKLPPLQKELIEGYYFLGYSRLELSDEYSLKISEVQAYLRQAIKSLKKSLDPFVQGKFGLKTDKIPDCPVCNSPFKDEIDELILKRNPRDTWKKAIKTLKQDFGIIIKTPQILIGHKKYHIKREV